MSDFWKDRKVIVTGASGFIGSHLIEELVKLEAKVSAFVHYNSRGEIGILRFVPPELLAQVDIIEGDLQDGNVVKNAIEDKQTVFHLGALISIPYSYIHPMQVVQTNIIGTLNVLSACRTCHVERLIHTSTSEVYGTACYTPIDEKHPLQAQSPYSASKIGADKIVESFYNAYGLPTVTVRPFNTYGPRQSSRAVIPTIITQALAKNSVRLGNLDTTRDFTYVSDTISGFLCAGSKENIEGKVFNLGTGTEIKIGNLAYKIIEMTGSSATIEIDKTRLRPKDSEVFRLISNHTEATNKIGWEPVITLEKGLLQTIDWIKSHLTNYKIGEYTI
jgi:NAD dependent epimerase/dehydratase